jgi:hypothetical protein
MAYSKAKLKSDGDKAPSCFKSFWIENYQTNVFRYMGSIYVSFKHILMGLANHMGIPDSMRILYNTSLLIES